ncbi:LysR family transcriptional regulator, pca operon transcriptional activator [Paracoccus halophilus]|uniref:LysR family transcriptional regulator n=1 Tax=Paracoccus halophilus TaxID=376733 RepID=A0A099F0N8_9RHOB|nr:pca operon transcription factor PcaQ [Paracoccus halophilus]KGJ04255.1 LysR family transcriptional regulator [Paracoccus halophilus]SFA52170.1 LysR family transcriptional regulator, pca operon transcriptional activator [Paracoccus halophilus]
MDRRIKIRHLQAFVEIVRRESLKRAAERLLLTQPAISRTLSELEEILGATLLERSRAGIALTAQGAFFHGFALASLSALERGLSGLQEFGSEAGLSLRVGALPSVAARLMPEVLDDLANVAPEMRLMIAEGSHEHLIGLLNRGELDVVLGRLGEPETMRGVSFTQLYLEEVALVVRPGHPILADPGLRRIGEWPVIYPPEKSAIRPYVRRLMIAEGVPLPPKRVESVSGDFGRARTQGSDSIWIISAGVVAREIAEGRLIRLPIDTRSTKGPVGMMVRAGEEDTTERRLFAQTVERTIARLGLAV